MLQKLKVSKEGIILNGDQNEEPCVSSRRQEILDRRTDVLRRPTLQEFAEHAISNGKLLAVHLKGYFLITHFK